MTIASKITTAHRQRLAVVYIRQSTMAQVRENTESTARQYALVDEAARRGWDSSSIVVIDSDLGTSGRSALGALQPRREDVQLCFRHRSFESHQEPVVEGAQIVRSVRVDDQCVGEAAQL